MENIVSYFVEWLQEYQPEKTLINQILWAVWAVWILLIFVAVYRVIKFRLCLGKEENLWGDGSGPQKNALVIVPIKGVTPSHTSDFFQSLLEQDYAKYRIIVTVEASDDPAAEWLCDQFGLTLSNPVWAPENTGRGLQSLQLVVAGKSKGRGQKVHNQLAAFEQLAADDEILAFVDADILCPPNWLAKLTCPINQGSDDPTTTYRWLVPKKRRLANLFASVINASVTTQGGNVRENMPWGGSMAISRATFNALDVPGLFEGSLNDDLRLGKAAKKNGYKVTYIRNLVRPTEIDFTWGKFFEFARRQYLQVKVFAPILYTSANFVFAIYAIGVVSVIASIVLGNLWAWIPLIIATILDQVRASTRESIYRHLFGNNRSTYHQIAKTSMVEHFLTPVYMAVHGLVIMSTWFMNKMEWGGVKYQVEGPQKTRVLGRQPFQSKVDLSTVGKLALPVGGVFAAISAISQGATADTSSAASSMEETVTLDESETISVSETETPAQTNIGATEPINPGGTLAAAGLAVAGAAGATALLADEETSTDEAAVEFSGEPEQENLIESEPEPLESPPENEEFSDEAADEVAPPAFDETPTDEVTDAEEVTDEISAPVFEDSSTKEETLNEIATPVFEDSSTEEETLDEIAGPDFEESPTEEVDIPEPEETLDEIAAPDFEESPTEEVDIPEPEETLDEIAAPDFEESPTEEVDIPTAEETVDEIAAPDFEESPTEEVDIPEPEEVVEENVTEDVTAPETEAVVEEPELEGKLFTFSKLGPATAVAAVAVGAAALAGDDETEEAEVEAEADETESIEPVAAELPEPEPTPVETAIPPGATEFFVTPPAAAEIPNEEVEPETETEAVVETPEELPEPLASDEPGSAAEWVQKDATQPLAPAAIAAAGQAAWVNENETSGEEVPEVSTEISTPSATPIVPNAPSAVVQIGNGAFQPMVGRTTSRVANPFYRHKKVAMPRVYLAKWKQLPRHQQRRLQRGK